MREDEFPVVPGEVYKAMTLTREDQRRSQEIKLLAAFHGPRLQRRLNIATLEHVLDRLGQKP